MILKSQVLQGVTKGTHDLRRARAFSHHGTRGHLSPAEAPRAVAHFYRPCRLVAVTDNLKHWRPTPTTNHVASAHGYRDVDSAMQAYITCLDRARVYPGSLENVFRSVHPPCGDRTSN